MLTDGCWLGITTDNATSNYLLTHELRSSLEVSFIEWPALWNHIPYTAHVIQLALGSFMSSLSVKGRTKSLVAHQHYEQFVENKSIDIWKCQRLRKEVNARINKVLANGPGLEKIIDKLCISRYFENSETELPIAENVCMSVYTDTW